MPQGDLFRSRLENILNRNYELCCLAELIPWEAFDEEFGVLYAEKKGSPGSRFDCWSACDVPWSYAYGLSGEEVVRRWPENPYYQFLRVARRHCKKDRRQLSESGSYATTTIY